jgi:hypothetical protein
MNDDVLLSIRFLFDELALDHVTFYIYVKPTLSTCSFSHLAAKKKFPSGAKMSFLETNLQD